MLINLPFKVSATQLEEAIFSCKKWFFIQRDYRKSTSYVVQNGFATGVRPSGFTLYFKLFPLMHWSIDILGDNALSVFAYFAPSSRVAKMICKKLEVISIQGGKLC